MAQDTKISLTAAKAACDAITALANGGKLRIYNGTKPADANVAVTTQTLLAELALSNPAFAASIDGEPGAVAFAHDVTDDSSANATGTASWFRVVDSSGDTCWDGTVSTTDGDMVLNTTSIVATAPVSISGWSFKTPEY